MKTQNEPADQFRHSLIFHLSNEDVMKKVKEAIDAEQAEKKAGEGKPFIQWEKFLKTKIANKIYL